MLPRAAEQPGSGQITQALPARMLSLSDRVNPMRQSEQRFLPGKGTAPVRAFLRPASVLGCRYGRRFCYSELDATLRFACDLFVKGLSTVTSGQS
jgi:hypothetical protein